MLKLLSTFGYRTVINFCIYIDVVCICITNDNVTTNTNIAFLISASPSTVNLPV